MIRLRNRCGRAGLSFGSYVVRKILLSMRRSRCRASKMRVAGVVLNADVQAVVIKDNFRFKSQFDAPLLRTYLEQHLSQECGSLEPKDYGVALARAIGKIRPELDVYLIVDGAAEKVASHLDSKNIRRIFYGIEDLMEIHLALLEGINQRYETPYFNNLKNYARRPIGTFHALPVARGKSVFNSHWIRDFGHFYGANIFMAESSATTGGLDSLLEPTGNIKVAQEKAARAFGCQQAVFRNERHVYFKQDRGAGDCSSGRHRPGRSELPQIASLRPRALRRSAALCRSLSAD